MNQKQLNSDLSEIGAAVDRADVPQPIKRLLKEILEWNRGLVDEMNVSTNVDLVPRVEALEGDVRDLLENAEGISNESAVVILSALEQSRNVNTAVRAMIAAGKVQLDDLAAKTLSKLIAASESAALQAISLVNELVIEDDAGYIGSAEDDDGEDDGEDDIDDDANVVAAEAAETGDE